MLLLLVFVGLKGCYVPPVVMAGGRPEIDLADFPPGTQLVELAVQDPDGEPRTLRGVAIPPPPGGPVLLHLLASQSSISVGSRVVGVIAINGDPQGAAVRAGGLGEALDDGWPPESPHGPLRVQHRWLSRVAALGWGGIAVDYEGVGASEGERHPDTLRQDARAAWDEALRLVGGESSRVILRGTSIGTLAVAMLLEDGARPGAIVLIAPVRAETVALNFASASWNPVLLWFASWFVRDAVDVDLLEVVAHARAPLLVVVPQDDWLLPPDERASLSEAVARAGGTLLVRRVSHEGLAIASRDLLAVELAYLQRHAPELLPPRLPRSLDAWRRALAEGRADGLDTEALQPGAAARQRLRVVLEQTVLPSDDLSLAAALAGVRDEELGHVSDWLNGFPPGRLDGRTLPELVALLDLADPDGRVDIELLAEASWVTAAGFDRDLDGLLKLYDEHVRHGGHRLVQFSVSSTGVITGFDTEATYTNALRVLRRDLVEAGTAEADADRLALRVLLKAAGLPDRVQVSQEGQRELQVLDGDAWRKVQTW